MPGLGDGIVGSHATHLAVGEEVDQATVRRVLHGATKVRPGAAGEPDDDAEYDRLKPHPCEHYAKGARGFQGPTAE